MAYGLPTELNIGGESYAIDPTVSNCLVIMQAFEDYELTSEQKVYILFDRLFEEMPPITEEIYRAAMVFLDGGESDKGSGQQRASTRYFSFTQDLKYIRAAIQRTHGVNIREKPDMHWWVFIDMFMDLDSDSFFAQMLQLRQKRAKGKLTKEEKKLWSEQREILTLKSPEAVAFEDEREAFEKELARLEGLANRG